MGPALLALKLMIAVYATALITGVILLIVGDPFTINRVAIVTATQAGLLVLLLLFLRNGSRVVRRVFAALCAFLLLLGDVVSSSRFAVMGNVASISSGLGLAGYWSSRLEKVGEAA